MNDLPNSSRKRGAPTWGVVGTMDEPPELVAAYAAHHLWAGASAVHIYLDRDDARTRALLAQLSNVHVTVADADHWRKVYDIKVPKTHQRRQTLNATHAYNLRSVDYLLHLDADEFLVQGEPIEKELRRLRNSRPEHYLRIGNLERVWPAGAATDDMFGGAFRASIKHADKDLSDLTLDSEGLTKFGLTGHSAGKACTPTGYDYVLGIHRPHLDTPRPWKHPGIRRSTTCTILHFDGMTPLHWVYKRLRKAMFLATQVGQPVSAQMEAQIDVIGDGGLDAARVLHDRIKMIEPAMQEALEAESLWFDMEFDPARALKALLPHETLDMSSQTFDAWLRAQKADVFEVLN